MNNSGENRWMKLRGMEGKSGEGKSERRDFSSGTHVRGVVTNEIATIVTMVEDRGVEIAYGVFIQGEGGEEGTSVKGNPFGPSCFLSGGKERQYVFT